MGLAYAALHPINHFRPQLLRADAQVSAPTFYDNRAQIQQLLSMGRTAKEVGQNTSNRQVARINAMGTMEKLFDPINSFNIQTEQQNITIENAFKQQRDPTMNQNVLTNLSALSKFIGENDLYKANLSKEKRLKNADTLNQEHNLTNNMITIGTLLERSPNMTENGSFWNDIRFKPGVPGINLLAGNGQVSSNTQSQDVAAIKQLMKDNDWTQAEAIAFLKYSSSGSSTRTEYDKNGIVVRKSVNSEN